MNLTLTFDTTTLTFIQEIFLINIYPYTKIGECPTKSTRVVKNPFFHETMDLTLTFDPMTLTFNQEILSMSTLIPSLVNVRPIEHELLQNTFFSGYPEFDLDL